MKRKYNTSLIKKKHLYTYHEIKVLFKTTISTIRRWRRRGLKVIDQNKRPLLIIGFELFRFLNKLNNSRKTVVKSEEFNCFRCKVARRSEDNSIILKMRESKSSENNHYADIIGHCERCGLRFRKFSSERDIKRMIKNETIILRHRQSLKWSPDSPLNARFCGGKDE